jgi:hypothetical protein
MRELSKTRGGAGSYEKAKTNFDGGSNRRSDRGGRFRAGQ